MPRDDFDTVPAQYSANNPSGGPSGNPNAIVVISMRASKKLKWKSNGVVTMVDLIAPAITNDAQTNGPTPINEYLIGQRYTHATHNIDWYKLYPRKEDNSGYYPYDSPTQTGRKQMGLHPGSTSLGCVTVDRAQAQPYDSNPQWIALRTYVDSGSMTYNGTGFCGFLYVINS
jgi:hypothetical protein